MLLLIPLFLPWWPELTQYKNVIVVMALLTPLGLLLFFLQQGLAICVDYAGRPKPQTIWLDLSVEADVMFTNFHRQMRKGSALLHS
jgi:hypothetical protein